MKYLLFLYWMIFFIDFVIAIHVCIIICKIYICTTSS